MRTKNRHILYVILLGLILGIIYTACKDITPEQEHIVNNIELKLNR